MSTRPNSVKSITAAGQQFRLAIYEPAPTRQATTVRELPPSERPAQRLIWQGAQALSLAELLTVAAGLPDLETAQRLLADNHGLSGLARLPISELLEVKGIGEARAAQLQAAFELGRRLLTAAPGERPQVKSPADAANLVMLEMQALEQEQIRTILLDTKNQVLKVHTVYIGSVNTVPIRIGELFREAVRLNCVALIVVHNHPSGDPTPSPEDVACTRQFVEAGQLLKIDVLDHLVIGHQRWVSLKERGLGFN